MLILDDRNVIESRDWVTEIRVNSDEDNIDEAWDNARSQADDDDIDSNPMNESAEHVDQSVVDDDTRDY